jgi:hypothetical protein
MSDFLTPRQQAEAARRAAKNKSDDSAIPAGYYGPRIDGQTPNLCHRHKRTIPLGHRCDIGWMEDVPDWVKVNPAKPCFNAGDTN